MNPTLGVSAIALGVAGIAGFYLLDALEKRNQRVCRRNQQELEDESRNIPQSDRAQGEHVASDIGASAERLRAWQSSSWLQRALVPPAEVVAPEDSSVGEPGTPVVVLAHLEEDRA